MARRVLRNSFSAHRALKCGQRIPKTTAGEPAGNPSGSFTIIGILESFLDTSCGIFQSLSKALNGVASILDCLRNFRRLVLAAKRNQLVP